MLCALAWIGMCKQVTAVLWQLEIIPTLDFALHGPLSRDWQKLPWSTWQKLAESPTFWNKRKRSGGKENRLITYARVSVWEREGVTIFIVHICIYTCSCMCVYIYIYDICYMYSFIYIQYMYRNPGAVRISLPNFVGGLRSEKCVVWDGFGCRQTKEKRRNRRYNIWVRFPSQIKMKMESIFYLGSLKLKSTYSRMIA